MVRHMPPADPKMRTELILKARRWKEGGGSVSVFARVNNLPRTTVSGWVRKEKPKIIGSERKVPQRNDHAVLSMLVESGTFNTQKSLRAYLNNKIDDVGARSVSRILRRWDLVCNEKSPSGNIAIIARDWKEPSESVASNTEPHKGILWQKNSGRGTEAFMITRDDSPETVNTVAAEIAPRLEKNRNRILYTNHERLAAALQALLPTREIKVTCSRCPKYS